MPGEDVATLHVEISHSKNILPPLIPFKGVLQQVGKWKGYDLLHKKLVSF